MTVINWNIQQIEARIQETKDSLNISGFAVGLIHNNTTLLSKAYGVRDTSTNALATTQTLFRLGSITKVFTATLLMHFVENGTVKLDDAVITYLPKFADFDPQGKITFKHLATHTSGLPMMPPTVVLPEDIDGMQSVTFPDIHALLEVLKETEALFPAGTDFTYSNYGVAILGHTLATIANKSYQDLIQEVILQPLKMSRTVFDPQPAHLEVATGYINFVEPPVVMPMVDIAGFEAAGQLFSTVDDMLIFIKSHWGQPSLGLTANTLAEMHKTCWEQEQAMAIGWKTIEIGDVPCIYHGGADPGYVSYLIIAPEQHLGIILMSNTAPRPDLIEALGNDIMLELLIFLAY